MLTFFVIQAFQIANLIREYTEVLNAGTEDTTKEPPTGGLIRHPQQLMTQQQQQQMQQLQQMNTLQHNQLANSNQLKLLQMQQAKTGTNNNMAPNQTHLISAKFY